VVAGCARAVRLLHRRVSSGSVEPGPVIDTFVRHATECGRSVLDACLQHQTESGLFHDIVDDPDSFEEVTLAAMVAYGAIAGVADGWLPRDYLPVGRSLLDIVTAQVGGDGLLRPACGSPTFDRPGISAEAQAVFLMAVAAAGQQPTY